MPNAFYQKYKADIFFLGGVLLMVTVMLGLMLNRFLTVVNHDSAIFCILAQSILKGHYLLVSEPNPQPYFTFPPLLSLQLAGLMLLFQNFDTQAMQPIFKGYIDLLFVCSIPLFYCWIRSMMARSHAMILTVLLAVNPIIFKYSSDILSDTPYWAFSMAALYAAWLYHQSTSGHTDKNASIKVRFGLWFSITLFLIVCCALTRQIGLALVVSFLITLGLRRQWKPLFIALATFVIFIGGWQSFEHFYRLEHRSDISSLNQQGVQAVLDKSPIKLEYVKHFLVDRPVDLDQNRLQNSPAILFQNIINRTGAYTQMTLDQFFPKIKLKLNGQKLILTHWIGPMLIVLILFATGLRHLFQAFPFASLYLSVYMAVLLVYPYISPRFLLPVFPLMTLAVYWGLLRLKNRLETRKGLSALASVTLPAFILFALIAQLPDTIHWINAGFQLKVANEGPSLRKGNQAYYRTLQWIAAHTPENSLIIARKPPVTYFYTGRRSTAFPFTANSDNLLTYITDKKQRYGTQFPCVYIFEDHVFGSSTRYLQPAVEKYRQRLSLVYTEPVTQSRVWLLK